MYLFKKIKKEQCNRAFLVLDARNTFLIFGKVIEPQTNLFDYFKTHIKKLLLDTESRH